MSTKHFKTAPRDHCAQSVLRTSGGPKTPVICLPGLTRNAADFEELAPILAATGRDIYAVSFRGRGRSDWDPDYKNYHPFVYRDDILALMDEQTIPKAIFIGTSLGGIVTMLLNLVAPDRVAAAVLNDIGPELAPEGLARIASYVGGTKGPANSLEEAAKHIKAINEVAFPDASMDDWLKFAKRTYRELESGDWILDYDPNIAKAMVDAGPAPDLWGSFESLKSTPTLVIRGAISDLLSPEIVSKMRAVHPQFDYCEVPRIGHAPMMTEPTAHAAIQEFLEKLD